MYEEFIPEIKVENAEINKLRDRISESFCFTIIDLFISYNAISKRAGLWFINIINRYLLLIFTIIDILQ